MPLSQYAVAHVNTFAILSNHRHSSDSSPRFAESPKNTKTVIDGGTPGMLSPALLSPQGF
jgi:hypothetical protein